MHMLVTHLNWIDSEGGTVFAVDESDAGYSEIVLEVETLDAIVLIADGLVSSEFCGIEIAFTAGC